MQESGLKPLVDLIGALVDVGNSTVPRFDVVEEIFHQLGAGQLESLPLEAAG